MAINEVLRFAEEDGYPLRLSDVQAFRGLTERMKEVGGAEMQHQEGSVLQEIEERLARLTQQAMEKELDAGTT